MTIHIRPATLADVSGLLPLMEQLGYPTTLSILEERFKRFVAQEGHFLVVACKEEHCVGYVAWTYTHTFVADKRRICIEGLVVNEAYRGQGIGKRLMTYVEERAQPYAPCIIGLTSGVRRAKDGTHDFYKALGYRNEGTMAKLYLRKEII